MSLAEPGLEETDPSFSQNYELQLSVTVNT